MKGRDVKEIIADTKNISELVGVGNKQNFRSEEIKRNGQRRVGIPDAFVAIKQ